MRLDLTISHPFSAPMAGVSDVAMRRIAVKWGASIAVGEMVSSDLSLYQSNKTSHRLQHDQSAGIRSSTGRKRPTQLAERSSMSI